MTTYSNPRTEAVVKDWPSGSKRVEARFYVETTPKKGQRAVRVTTGSPKKLTYSPLVRIADGDDGRTYILELSLYGHISVMKGDMKFQHEVIYSRDPRYAELVALIKG